MSRAIRKHDRKDVVGCWKGPQKTFFGVMKGTKKYIKNDRGAK
jgi:hypothetical protein